MTVWVEDLGHGWMGHTFAVSTEYHDGIIYSADSIEDAVRKYEKEWHRKVDNIKEV